MSSRDYLIILYLLSNGKKSIFFFNFIYCSILKIIIHSSQTAFVSLKYSFFKFPLAKLNIFHEILQVTSFYNDENTELYVIMINLT